ncbi:M81 family metallopeptidase [Paenibacillus sp. UNC451MF]|uniref:M81 family metallopeptidase n=1 Tax=Paenibacillus sp. UNC451MF TaxID=1449063 RepID=UPI0004905EF1|nr:M81 family metallopeptidase [Paenibacillus sp. UNC451MF]
MCRGKAKKVLIGSLIQESNTFTPARSSMEDFYRHHWVIGEAIRDLRTENELWGFMREAVDEGIEAIPVLSANAVSSGMLTAQAFAELKTSLRELLQTAFRDAGSCDGVYFALHGAMVAEDCDDTEGELIAVIRQCIGPDIPLVVSLDLHANVTRNMVRQVDGLVGFRTYPHTDFAETGRRAAKLLFATVRGEIGPIVIMRKLPLIVPAENSQTTSGPFAEMWAEAEAGEERGDSLVTSLFPVQPWLDIEEMGSTVVIVGDARRKEAAIEEAERLASLFWEMRKEFDIRLCSVQEVVEKLWQLQPGEGPMVVSDSADSPSAGSLGDSNAVLQGLLASGIYESYSCLITMVDTPAVMKAITSGVGQEVTLSLGGAVSSMDSNRRIRPIEAKGIVRRIGDGRFFLKGGYAKNTEAFMGRCVVFDIGRISVLITERATFSGDPSMYRSMGLEPCEADLVMVKSANQFRVDYGKMTRHIYILDTPGYSTANIKALSFRKIARPFYPFDDDWKDHPLYGTACQKREDEDNERS